MYLYPMAIKRKKKKKGDPMEVGAVTQDLDETICGVCNDDMEDEFNDLF